MMDDFGWDDFLRRYSQEILADESLHNIIPENARRLGWLGYEGATDSQILTLESSINLSLPRSYLSFLRISNGWYLTSPFVHRLWSSEDVGWFAPRHPEWVEAYKRPYSLLAPITDQEYFVYGQEQNSSKFRPEYLESALEISEVGDAAVYLLNPRVVDAEGEWEAWFFADWLPGAVRYRSFRELMMSARGQFLEGS